MSVVNSLGLGGVNSVALRGLTGPTGRGISTIEQGTGLSLDITYTDGTVDNVGLTNLFNPNDTVADTLADNATFTGNVLINGTNSTTKLKIDDSLNNNIFKVDTDNNIVESTGLLRSKGLEVKDSNDATAFQITEYSDFGEATFNISTLLSSLHILDVNSDSFFSAIYETGKVKIFGADISDKFRVEDSSNIKQFSINTATGETTTKNNTLDNGSGNTTTVGTSTIQGTNSSSKFKVSDNSSVSIFNVNTSTGATTTKNNTLDDGSGNSVLVGNNVIQGSNSSTKLMVRNSSNYPVIAVDTIDKFLLIGSNTSTKLRLFVDDTSNSFGMAFNVGKNFTTMDNVNIGSFAWTAWAGDGGNPPNLGLMITNGNIGAPTAYVYFQPTVIWPARNNISLGKNSSSNSWANIYSQTSVVVTSDRNHKNTIEDETLGVDFINSLKPRSFKLNNGTNGRKHHGLIAQEVLDTLNEFSIPTSDFAGYISSNNEITKVSNNDEFNINPSTYYSLRYEEFIAPMIKAIQELSAKCDSLQQQINDLSG